MLTATRLPSVSCRDCEKPMRLREVLFVEDWTVVVNGICPACRRLISYTFTALELFPRGKEKGN